jgi:YVTN family beta-propeller protein
VKIMARSKVLFMVLLFTVGAGGTLRAAPCGPFTDLSFDDPFCPAILQMYYLGLTAGTSPTTFGPTQPVTRQVLAAFLARESRVIARGVGRRAALRQFWTITATDALAGTTVGFVPEFCISDGDDVWVTVNSGSYEVKRIRARDGALLGTWTGLPGANAILVAMGKVFVAAGGSPGRLYKLDPSLPPTAVTLVSAALGNGTIDLAFDGARIWTANPGGNSVSIVPPSGAPVSTVGGFSAPSGIVYDGSNIWVANAGNATLTRLDAAGSILDTVPVGAAPQRLVFDGTNIWVTNYNDSTLSVVNAASRAVVATLSGNGLNNPFAAAFDGDRVLVGSPSGDTVSVWRAADLAPLGSVSPGVGTAPAGVCSDGIDFWIPLAGSDKIERF